MADHARAGTIALDLEQVAGLGAEEASRRARLALRHGDVARRTAAFYLAEIRERELWRPLGFASWQHYVKSGLQRPLSTIDGYVRVGLELPELPAIDAEFAAGRLNFSKVKRLVAVASRETDAAWARVGVAGDLRQVEAATQGKQKGESPGSPDRRRIHAEKVKVVLEFSSTGYRVWERYRRKVRDEGGGTLSDTDLGELAARTHLRRQADGSVPGWREVRTEHYVIHAWPVAGGGPDDLATRGEDGEVVPISRRALLRPLGGAPGAAEEEAGAAATGGPQAEGRDPSPVELDPDNHGEVLPEDRRDRPTSAAQRERVLVRDGHCCLVCGSRHNLQAHHLHWRRYGGRTVMSNLVTLCEGCHSKVHERFMVLHLDPRRGLLCLGPDGRELGREPELAVEVPPPRPATAEERGGDEEPRGEAEEESMRVETTTARLADLIGQTAVRERLWLAVEAARRRGERPGHHLLCGEPGLGKTALAEALAGELGAPLVRLPAPFVASAARLVRTLTSLPEGAVLFVDELHALSEHEAEVLYQPLDSGRLSLPRRETIALPGFVFVGATSEEHQVPRALRSRLQIERLEPYSLSELAELVTRAAQGLGFALAPAAARRLAGAARDTPREALLLLRDLHDMVTLARVATADEALVEAALALRQVDWLGRGPLDRAYLEELAQDGRPVGFATLAGALGVSEGTLREVDRFLQRRRWVRVTPRGRVLTPQGLATPTVWEREAELPQRGWGAG